MSDEGGPALFRLVRFWSRRWARGVATDVGQAAAVPQHILVVDAVDTLRRRGSEATVGDLAQQLGLDRSNASRMIAAAAREGFLDRRRPQTDGRRTVLALTPTGQDLLASSRQWQRTTFAEITAGWSAHDRVEFARYLERLALDVGA